MIEEIKREIDERVSKLVVDHITNLLTDTHGENLSDYNIWIRYYESLGEYIDSKILLHRYKKRYRDYPFYDERRERYAEDYFKMLRKVLHNKNLKNRLKKQLIFSGLQNKT